MFISREGLWEETRELINENMDTPVSFGQALRLKNHKQRETTTETENEQNHNPGK